MFPDWRWGFALQSHWGASVDRGLARNLKGSHGGAVWVSWKRKSPNKNMYPRLLWAKSWSGAHYFHPCFVAWVSITWPLLAARESGNVVYLCPRKWGNQARGGAGSLCHTSSNSNNEFCLIIYRQTALPGSLNFMVQPNADPLLFSAQSLLLPIIHRLMLLRFRFS